MTSASVHEPPTTQTHEFGSQFVVHVQQQSSNVGAIGKIQGPVRPVKVKKTTVPSFIGLKLRLQVVKMLAVFLRFLF